MLRFRHGKFELSVKFPRRQLNIPFEFTGEDWAGNTKFGSHQHLNGITIRVLWEAHSEADFSVSAI